MENASSESHNYTAQPKVILTSERVCASDVLMNSLECFSSRSDLPFVCSASISGPAANNSPLLLDTRLDFHQHNKQLCQSCFSTSLFYSSLDALSICLVLF